MSVVRQCRREALDFNEILSSRTEARLLLTVAHSEKAILRGSVRQSRTRTGHRRMRRVGYLDVEIECFVHQPTVGRENEEVRGTGDGTAKKGMMMWNTMEGQDQNRLRAAQHERVVLVNVCC